MFKLIIFIVIAGTAGGLTYFGGPNSGNSGQIALELENLELENLESVREASEPQIESTLEASANKSESSDKPKQRWMGKYLNTMKDASRQIIKPPLKEAANESEDGDKAKQRWMDKYLKIGSRTDDSLDSDERVEKGTAVLIIKPTPTDREADVPPDSTPPPNSKPTEPDAIFYKLENGTLTEVDIYTLSREHGGRDKGEADAQKKLKPPPKAEPPKTEPPKTDMAASGELPLDADSRIVTSMSEAAHIRQTDLRDRAYMSIVDYCNMTQQFDSAITALQYIEQAELRDTARSRIAVTLAIGGQTQQAFALIDDVETDGLRDVMRLQVIESMVMPTQLPPGMIVE